MTGFTYGDFQDALKGCPAENVVKGGHPILNRVVEIAQEEGEGFASDKFVPRKVRLINDGKSGY